MKFKPLYIFVFFVLFSASCKKDLGNYTYNPPSEPVIAGIRNVTYSASIGDSLVIKPTITLADADPLKDLSFEWKITVQELFKEVSYTGYPLKMVYNLGPGERPAKLIVTDKRNGLIYSIPFRITGTTQFSTGELVLSNDRGLAKFSFIKPDNTVLPDLYQSLNGAPLPSNPVQLYYSKPLAYQPNTKEEFWLICNDPAMSSVILDASTLLRKSSFETQFFTPPTQIVPGYLEPLLYPAQMGTVPNGIINGKLYIGVTSTAPNADDYGKFSNEQQGDYNLSKYFLHGTNFYLGYDLKAKAFVTFSGDGSYTGANYPIDPKSTGFDPKKVGLDNLLFMNAVEGGTSYAFFKAADGTVNELSFSYPIEDDKNFKALNKRAFKGTAMINEDTKWQRNSLNVFYFSSNDKIYRYNPINEDIRVLDADFGGKKVSMIKISNNDNTLMVGVEGSIYTLNVTTGVNGIITKTITGIPGSPIDMIIKN
jgi:hypothetical protein